MYSTAKQILKKSFYKKPLIWKILESAQGVRYAFNYFYYYRLQGKEHRSSIRELHIEFASACNLRCKFCALDHDKPKVTMTTDTLRSVFQQITVEPIFKRIERIHLHNGGEVLLHPKRLELLGIIKEFKDFAKLHNKHFPEIHLLTNGMLLREKLSRDLLGLEVIDALGFSMDGGTPEDYESMRLLAKWPVFYKNLKTFTQLNAQAKQPIQTFAITCVPDSKPLGLDWMHPEFKDALLSVDRYELRRLHNWGGEISEVSAPAKSHKIGCDLLMHQMVILPDANVTVCCTDLNSKGVIGNLNDSSLEDIYFSNERKKYLEYLLKGRKSELDLCRDCETF